MKIVLCDDNAIYLKEAEDILQEYAREADISFDLVSFTDSVAMCAQDEAVPDILFLDIRMDAQDGIKTAEKVNQKWPKCRIVYLTDYLSYATDVYQTEHIYYVLKPQLRDRIGQVMEKILRDIASDEVKLVIREKNAEVVVTSGEILYFERSLRKTIITTRSGTYETREKLPELESRLPEASFVRCHNSYLVAIAAIKKMGRDSLEMSDGMTIPISRQYQRTVKLAFAQWLAAHS